MWSRQHQVTLWTFFFMALVKDLSLKVTEEVFGQVKLGPSLIEDKICQLDDLCHKCRDILAITPIVLGNYSDAQHVIDMEMPHQFMIPAGKSTLW